MNTHPSTSLRAGLATVTNDAAPSQQDGPHAALVLIDAHSLDRNPAAVYLAGLAQGSRRTMREALQTIAAMLRADVARLDWAALRFQHTSAIRARLAEAYSPATANKMLSALRGH